MKKFLSLLISFLPFFVMNAQQSEEAVLHQMINKYVTSINECDTLLGRSIWAHSEEVSFIAPSGRMERWEEIKNNFMLGAMGNFSQRNLKSLTEIINIYGDVAWIEFFWEFDAVRKDGSPHNAKGRETQILRKIDGEWKFVHIHYSGGSNR
jgi:ketosteroid isomerase-like protein